MAYLDGNRLHFYGSGGDSYLYHGGPGIDRLRLVEDEVADAVVDGFAAILFDGLKRMGMVTTMQSAPASIMRCASFCW